MNLRYENKSKLVNKVFNEVYDKYDLMNDIMSLGTHRIWKKNLVSWINPSKDDQIFHTLMTMMFLFLHKE